MRDLWIFVFKKGKIVWMFVYVYACTSIPRFVYSEPYLTFRTNINVVFSEQSLKPY